MNERFTPEEKKELQETLARIYKSTPYFQTLPCRVIDFDRGEVRIDFPVEEPTLQKPSNTAATKRRE